MSRNSLTLVLGSTTRTFQIFHDGRKRIWERTSRPSQQGDPGQPFVAEWRLDGPDFFSTEYIGPGQESGFLGRDYGDGIDGRWLDTAILGPQINEVDLTIYDLASSPTLLGTTPVLILGPSYGLDNALGQAEIVVSGNTFAFIARGQQIAKVRLANMTVWRSDLQLTALATSVLASQADSSVGQQVSVGVGDDVAYQIVAASGVSRRQGTPDTWAANDQSQAARILRHRSDRVVALANNVAGATNASVIRGNILSGATDMKASAWATIATLRGANRRLTGYAQDGPLDVIAASDGVFYLDQDTGRFWNVLPQITRDNRNGTSITYWPPMGVSIALRDGDRWFRNGTSESWGTSRFLGNESSITGLTTAQEGNSRWMYQVKYNEVTTRSWLLAWRPRQAGDLHPQEYVPFIIANLGLRRSNYLRYVGDVDGERSTLTLMGGYGSNIFNMIIGSREREIDDTNYRFATSGTLYLTEMRRYPGLTKDLNHVEFETSGVTGARTIQVGFVVDGAAVQNLTAVTSGAWQRQRFVDTATPAAPLTWASGRRVKPQIAFVTDSATASPRTIGTLRLYGTLRPEVVNTYHFMVEITEEEQADALMETYYSGGKVRIISDPDEDTYYAIMTTSPEIKEVQLSDRGDASGQGSVRVAEVFMIAVEGT